MEISNLPGDVLLNILLRLPVKPLIRFSLSSKHFLSLIHHPDFINRHSTRSTTYRSPDDSFLLLCFGFKDFKQYCSLCSFKDGGKTLFEHKKLQLPFESRHGDSGLGFIRLVSSSNGLVCLFDTSSLHPHRGEIILWNAIIGKCKKLPRPSLKHLFRNSFYHAVVGFGYVLETNDFKVVQILYHLESDEVPDVLVYSMELNNWRKIEANIVRCTDRLRDSNVYLNGAVHWLAYSYKKLMVGGFSHSIISFDMKGEIFKEMALPNNHRNDIDNLLMFASASGETLSLFIKSKDNNQWEVWLMKEYGVVDSWTRQFCIADGLTSWPFNVMDNGDVLLEDSSRNLRKLVLCDAESEQIKDLVLCDAKNQKMMYLGIDRMRLFSVVTCSPSLCMLDRGEKDLLYSKREVAPLVRRRPFLLDCLKCLWCGPAK